MVRTNKWIQFLKDYASNNDMTYNQAMKDPKAKTLYTRQKSVKEGEGIFDWFKSDNTESTQPTVQTEPKQEVGFFDWMKSLGSSKTQNTTSQGSVLTKSQKKEYDQYNDKKYKNNQKNTTRQLEASNDYLNSFDYTPIKTPKKTTDANGNTMFQLSPEAQAKYDKLYANHKATSGANYQQEQQKKQDQTNKYLENLTFQNNQDYHHYGDMTGKTKYDSKNPPQYFGYGFTEAINFIKGDFGYTQKSKEILSKFGDFKITSAEVIRKPIEKLWNTVLSSISKNYKSELKKQSYDELYHLCIVFTLVNGKRIMIEKNAVIQITVNPPPIKNSESVTINNFPDISINQILKASHDKIGSSAFFRYSANKNNCQHFIFNLLKNSNISTPELEQFIMQSVDKLFNPTLTKFSKTLTDIGGTATMLLDN